MRRWSVVFGVLVGLYLAWTPPSWAQSGFDSTQTPGDVGTEACREAQLAVQEEVGDRINPPYKNIGQYLIAAVRAVKPALKAGEITGACSFCIVLQFAKSSRIANQKPCGPDPEPELCDPLSCEDNDACTGDHCDPETGCVYELIDCDDNNACTEDTCDSVFGCFNTPISCDDDNECTADNCDPDFGCVHTDICGEP